MHFSAFGNTATKPAAAKRSASIISRHQPADQRADARLPDQRHAGEEAAPPRHLRDIGGRKQLGRCGLARGTGSDFADEGKSIGWEVFKDLGGQIIQTKGMSCCAVSGGLRVEGAMLRI